MEPRYWAIITPVKFSSLSTQKYVDAAPAQPNSFLPVKESAFDCTLNYARNKIQSPGLVCLDYETKDRNEYLFTPGLQDTQDIIDTKQEFTLATQYTKIENKGSVYYVENFPSANGKFYIYDDTLMTRVRKPKPVGVVVFKNGKKNYGFYPKKK